jgi:hypothetical protein
LSTLIFSVLLCNAIGELILILAIIISLFNEHYNARPPDLHISPCSEFCWRQITKPEKSHSVRICAVNVLYVSASLWLWHNRLPPIDHALFLLLFFFLGLVFIIDLEHRLIFHKLSIFGFIFGLIIGINLNGLIPTLVGGLFYFIFIITIFHLRRISVETVGSSKGSNY